MRPACICGCGDPVAAMHHVCYRQHIPAALLDDERNLVPVAFRCHGNHHAASKRYLLHMLPDSVFEFAAEVLGPGKAFNYLRRRYDGQDPRLDALLEGVAA